jgi:nitrate reductase assembly molybdenum cofactor insertion protein NarJ
MASTAPVLDRMAGLLEYPTPEYQERLTAIAASVVPLNAAAAEQLKAFADAVGGRSLSELEESYVLTFDLNPDACLDIGWHLFGEDYARGEFLVKLRQEMRRYGIAERDELPDSLLSVLPLVARMPDEEAVHFCDAFLLPALEKIRKAVPVESNPFANLLAALASLLAGDRTDAQPTKGRSDE